MPENDGEAPTMNVNKLVIPIGAVTTLLIAFMSSYLYLESKFDEAGAERQAIRDKIVLNSNNDRREFDRLDSEMRSMGRDRIYRAEVELWAERLKSANPELDIPELPNSD